MPGIPLISLRPDLDAGWPPGVHWRSSGGVARAELHQPLGSRISFPITGGTARVRLRGRVEAIAVDRPGIVRVGLSLLDSSRRERRIWSSRLVTLGRRRLPRARRLDVAFQAPGETQLMLSGTGPAEGAVRWQGLEVSIGANDPFRSEDEMEARGPEGRGPEPSRPLPPATARTPAPRFSILTPVHDPPLDLLQQTLDSVLAQSFADWELCLVDDGSKDSRIIETLRDLAAVEPRVRLTRRDRAGGIASATNAALEVARGEFVALLDHDDLLVPDALSQIDAALRAQPQADLVYSDEQVIGEDGFRFVFAKPHWSPDLLRSQMYICHLGVYRRSLAQEIGGFRPGFDGSQDYDFALRFSERARAIVHVPRVLYHWRAHAASTAANAQAKPSAYPAARRAIAEHLRRAGIEADIHFGPWQGIYRVVHKPSPGTRIRVAIVGEESAPPVRALIEAVEDESRSGVAGALPTVGPTLEAACADDAGCRVIVVCDGAFEALTRFWLARLVGFALQEGVAAAGARTVAGDGRVEASGLAVDRGSPLPLMLGCAAGDPGPLCIGILPANVTAVDGIAALDAELLRRNGGLDPEFGSLAVPDYCLRARETGLRVISTPDVLVRRRGRARVSDLEELERFRRRWAPLLDRDPYFDLGACWPGVELAAAASG